MPVEWAPDFGMRPVLTDIGNGSRGHECAGEPWGPPDTTHRIELIGERDTITFRCDGRELFSARRHFARPYRKITVSSYAGASMAAVRIEGDHAVAARQPARRLAAHVRARQGRRLRLGARARGGPPAGRPLGENGGAAVVAPVA